MKPILFNTSMVQAILEGRKTSTRRIAKGLKDAIKETKGDFKWDYNHSFMNDICLLSEAPYKVGDILYVRETWCRGKVEIEDTTDGFQGETYISQCIGDEDIIFKQQAIQEGIDISETKWKPSIFMPKEAARIFLKVKSVRVEKLQDITEEGCLEEGIRKYTKDGELFKYSVNESMYKWQDMPKEPKEAFKDLWNSTLNKKTGWNYKYENNPYVWVIEFEIISREEAFNE